MSYKGTLKEGGSTFDQAKKFKFCLGAGEVIKGWEVKSLNIGSGRIRQFSFPPMENDDIE